jgi:putative pre-16S rRNA nuclease
MRYLAIDLGDKRTGLALGDDETRLAAPVGCVEVSIKHANGQALLDALADAIDEQIGDGNPGELVMGLPLHMDGNEGQRTRIVRAFAARLEAATGRVIHLHDERLTSIDADWAMAESGFTHGQKKARRDALAAAAILRSFLSTPSPPDSEA